MVVETPQTLAQALDHAANVLAASGVDDASRDAAVLLASAAGLSRAAIIAGQNELLPSLALERFWSYVERRCQREPVGCILGRRDFWKDEFEVSPDVLEPRPDSETLIEAVLAHSRHRSGDPIKILDLGVGSGALLASLLREFPHAWGLGVDASPAACTVARRNIERLGLAARAEIKQLNWENLDHSTWDIVVSNPPYIASSSLDHLEPEVRNWDPTMALDGGDDGLDAYRSLARVLPHLVASSGFSVLEIGFDQAATVPKILQKAGLEIREIRRDLGGNPRALVASMRQ